MSHHLPSQAIFQIAETIGSISIEHQSEARASDKCVIDVDPEVFVIWDPGPDYLHRLVNPDWILGINKWLCSHKTTGVWLFTHGQIAMA